MPTLSTRDLVAGLLYLSLVLGSWTPLWAQSDPIPKVLLDSYHAHNFLDRGLVPGEHLYHQLTALRRATGLLKDRGVEVDELLFGPITPARLAGVQLFIVNLTSIDRPPWLVGEIEALTDYVRGGGGILFITDHSNCYYHQYHLLPLWERLGLIPSFETVCERAPECRMSPSGNAWILVRRFQSHPITSGIRYLAMQTGGRVVGDQVLAQTSDDAWADAGATPLYAEGPIGLLGDLIYSASEESGSQGVILAKNFGAGRIVVIGDQNAMGDMLISYADNWRLWLNACQWAGRLNISTGPLTLPATASPSSVNASTRAPDQVPAFDQLVSQEPDRNAQPALPPGKWQVECWEPLTAGRFHWGGNDADQLYYFWCWLNRWTWTSADQGPNHPRPGGRPLVLAVESDLVTGSESGDASLQKRIAQLQQSGGKLLLLSRSDRNANIGPPTAAAIQWRDATIQKLEALRTAIATDKPRIPARAAVTWHDQPIGHWQYPMGQATCILIPDAQPLRNARFDPPERMPSVAQAKWLEQLYRWLFEQS